MVEGPTEKRLIPELMEHNGVNWVVAPDQYAVRIEDYGGFEKMMQPHQLETVLKITGVKSVGILFDADELHDGLSPRWSAVAARLKRIGVEPPSHLPPGGFISQHQSGIKIGAWMMPDNQNRGMLETFLMQLVPSDEPSKTIYNHAVRATDEASGLGAPYRSVHRDKAIIYNWLAWQDAPGAQLHEAVKYKVLDPDSISAVPFVNWFRSLFNV